LRFEDFVSPAKRATAEHVFLSRVERVVLNALAIDAALPPEIYTFGDPIYHRSEPDWHFQEKPIHLWAARSLTPATPDHPVVER
jgi:hypothetical protein